MIFRCSGKIAQRLCLSEIISEDEYELYQCKYVIIRTLTF